MRCPRRSAGCRPASSPTSRRASRSALLGDLDALPERHPPLDLASRFLRLRVVPDGVRIEVAVHHHAVVVGLALPRAHRAVIAEAVSYTHLRAHETPEHL